ncbi:PAB-dependent poly(A)-specific ribonuclease subunit pan3 [Aspergillus japonicus CBS 114.51]|uniref:PAN2-PAN3 deadenylation complex subunit PAN3 n=3 Tax=Aspergillus TaxID=5052 RepID=A0A2V5HM03_ASPV1|nr:PAB-dependent poly(A)-specific ribonuclease subunit pan3 [Aspergillus japonicus CBS 114.51]PYI23074.1 PAB-dependent poly(A)-specific ribonuclease subunit pan3 [Aspergillus violaceofuscus CBS 115571]PYI31942.1 PAB-dependent poly(A)-specific ribonuclease subunit pan3 [Aspergillus indologenus CBS 114.80]RAH80954.1 PAB-dependent poly(A)-specific ribonuclease subunit pan3 [Aspergillus japonicus CBS 114.51]
MASTGKSTTTLDDSRRATGSPKMKARAENAKDTLCRNVTIYGRCRYEDKGCAFNHDPHKVNSYADRKRLNVDSPSFTPTLLSSNGSSPTIASATMKKTATISPKAANAAPFQPRSISSRSNSSTPTARQGTMTPDWSVAEVQEFVPQGFDGSHMASLQGNGTSTIPTTTAFDPFVTSPNPLSAANAVGPVQANPFTHDTAAALGGAAFFANQSGFQQPVQYHMYAPIGPHSQNTLGYQRNVHDLFLPNDFREELQKKAAATLQTLPNTQLPAQVDYFHSLVPLDLNHQKNAAIFGYPSWVYKAQSSKDGNFYALRRLEGFRLTNEKAIRSVQAWKRVCSGSVVTVHDAFTSRSFQDSSLIFVTDYHPLSKTLAEQHLGAGNRFTGRQNTHIPEQILWSYMTQLGNALKAIHSNGLAARIIDASKILLTGKNRIRLSACAILDVVQFDTQRSVADLQRQDLVNFGQLIVTLGANAPNVLHNPTKAMEHFTRAYSPQLKNSVFWLLNGLQKDQDRNIDIFITGISSQLMSTFDSALHLDDQLTSDLSRELENGRLVRLMTKLNLVNERPEYDHDRQWAETGERYFLKIFRDYVFHQVDAQGDPAVDLGHVLTCLNKLDAGSDEKVTLVSRDEQSCFVVSYKELKKALESSFQALLKPSSGRRIH